MTTDQIVVLAILAATMGLFVWGRWRHDMVAIAALLAVVLVGLMPAESAFDGFGNPAVVTVACVLMISHGLQSSGAVDLLARAVLPSESGPLVTVTVLTLLAATLSAFMNNVGALALLMPIALQVASRLGLQPGQLLMPLSFGSILGGMTTLIGTPPNLIVAGFREQTTGEAFSMFDFSPVGVAVAASGILLIGLTGKWLIPIRERAQGDGFEIAKYLTEALIGKDSKVKDLTLRAVEAALEEADAQVVGLVRDEVRLPGPHPGRRVREGDILVIEAEPEALAKVLATLNLKLVEDQPEAAKSKEEGAGEGAGLPAAAPAADAVIVPSAAAADADQKADKSPDEEEVVLMELAILPDARIIGRSANSVHLRTRFGVNLLAVSRHGSRTISRLRSLTFRAGDVLLLQGTTSALMEFGAYSGSVPLAERALRLPNRRAAYTAGGIMAAAIGAVTLGLTSAPVAFAAAVLAIMATRVVAPRNIYQAVDWSVVVMLGALLALADAMAATGTADVIARYLMDDVARGNAVIALVLILVVTMVLTDFMNNAATVAVLCPIAIGAADSLGVNPDAFLMAVAVGGSCAFLTPIGHQNNTLILGPAGFRFGDYWPLGLPLEVLIVAVAVPMILLVWPL